MDKIIKKYLGKGVSVTTVETTESGRLIDFQDGWLTLSNKGKEEDINSNHVVLIKPCKLPEDKRK